MDEIVFNICVSWVSLPLVNFRILFHLWSVWTFLYISRSLLVKKDYRFTDTPISIFLLAICTSLESQTTINLTVFATSAFSKHSLVSTVLVVQQVVNGLFFL